MTKPLIGIVPLYDEEKESYWMLPGYMKSVEQSGGIPVMLPLTTNRATLDSIMNKFDGFLFTGGQDISPALYGEERLPLCGDACRERDDMETYLFQSALGMDKPMFGICRGFQMFTALLGGTLYQDITAQLKAETHVPHKQEPPYEKPLHTVRIEKTSPLYNLLEKETLEVNSYHHQGAKDPGKAFVPMATSEDGLVEAAYLPDKRFVWAVQWHPEFSYAVDESSRKLFDRFVAVSGE